jgi:hypothetical protein
MGKTCSFHVLTFKRRTCGKKDKILLILKTPIQKSWTASGHRRKTNASTHGKISHFREKNKKIPFSPPPVKFATIKIVGISSFLCCQGIYKKEMGLWLFTGVTIK